MPSTRVPLSLNLDAAERRAGVGGEVGRAGAGREDADISCLHCLDSLPLRVELADRLHADSCEHLSLHAQCAERRAECERVDDGSAHAHLVALHAVEAFRCTAESAEDVAAADDDANLHAHFVYFLDLLCVFAQTNGVNTEALLAHEALATELEENSLEFCHVVCFVCFICYCWGVISAWLVHFRGCSCLSCTNRAVGAILCFVGALLALLVHLRQVHPLVMQMYCFFVM